MERASAPTAGGVQEPGALNSSGSSQGQSAAGSGARSNNASLAARAVSVVLSQRNPSSCFLDHAALRLACKELLLARDSTVLQRSLSQDGDGGLFVFTERLPAGDEGRREVCRLLNRPGCSRPNGIGVEVDPEAMSEEDL